ncbi:hypothetical protein [Micromonospora sp. DT62]|uniref:hypothetical protein n=1 Tax=Micromonospora sp. DT62 TaxID=3416521 RepID=UPI003CE80609
MGRNGRFRTGRKDQQERRVWCPAGGADRSRKGRPPGTPDDGVEEETYVLVTLRIVGMPA